MNLNKYLFVIAYLFSILSYSQHNVKVKVGEQVYTVSGDTTKHNFKSAIAKLEQRFGDAAIHKLNAIKVGEIKDIHTAYYEIACFYGQDKDHEQSAAYLLKSIDNGWKDMAHLEYDPDLASLRGTKFWKQITPRIDNYYNSNNRTIARLYANDQSARLSGKVNDNLKKEDSIRRITVISLLKKEEIKSSDDFYKAAMIMHHGNNLEDYELAHKLAKRSYKKKNPHYMAPWLVAATKDRYLQKKGEKQWYGTQGLTYKNGKMALDPNIIDLEAVDEKRRAELNAPSLDKIKSYIEAFTTE